MEKSSISLFRSIPDFVRIREPNHVLMVLWRQNRVDAQLKDGNVWSIVVVRYGEDVAFISGYGGAFIICEVYIWSFSVMFYVVDVRFLSKVYFNGV